MKKSLLIAFIFICILPLVCCKKKKLDYMFVGAYIEILNGQDKTINDRNIKLYYNQNNNVLEDTNGIYEYRLITESITKDVKEEKDRVVYDFSALYSINCDLEEVNVYPIILKEGKYEVLTEEVKKIKLEVNESKGITITKNYHYDDKEYYFKIIIKILKKEG